MDSRTTACGSCWGGPVLEGGGWLAEGVGSDPTPAAGARTVVVWQADLQQAIVTLVTACCAVQVVCPN